MSRRSTLLVLTLILLLAAATRILHIGEQSLWIDEGATYYILSQPDRIEALAHRDHHPPLYYALLDGWIALAGDSVVAMRMLSAFFSLLSVAAVYPLARTVNRDRPWFRDSIVPILAVLLLTLSDPEVVLAQEIRMYALRTLLALLSMLFYIRWTQRATTRRAALWVITTALLLHTQYQGLYIPAVQGLHALLFLRGRQRLDAIGLLALIGVLFLPWALLYGFDQRLNDPGVNAALPSNGETLIQLREKFLTDQWPLMLGLFVLGTFALIDDRRSQWRPFGPTFLLTAWVLVTLIVTFVGNLWFPILAPHRILLLTPALAILIAQGLRNISPPARGFLVAVIVVYGVTTVDDYYPKPPWDEVGASMAQFARPGEMSLLENFRADNPLRYYLDHLMPADTDIRSLRQWRAYEPQTYPDGVIDLLSEHPTVWLMHWSPDQSAFNFLAATNHVRTATFTTDHWGNDLNVYRYDQLPETPAVRFESGIDLRQYAIHPDIMRVDLWWSADAPLPVDFSISAFVLDDAGQLVAQYDSGPLQNQRPTTSWTPGEVIYDPRPLQPSELPPGTYSVGVQIYTWFDNARLPTLAGEPWAILETITF
ncbi:MAG: hypothetical protein GYB67_18855 [Chloroflexi bacterium]|nr:hypothetical protein [Chloroflexota bacterium]